MPWEVKKSGSQYCVYKKGASSPIKGGCHSTRSQAVKHMQALYANEPSAVAAAADMEPYLADDGLWHIDNVPIVSTGIEYKLSTGPVTFTEEQLADAVSAQEDPAVVQPRIKLGHSDKVNDFLLGDGEPAFGRVENMTIGENGQTIYGDYVGTPAWLANILPIAFPNRSIEAVFDVNTVTGKSYQMVIYDVSLLGVRWPGVAVLEDLPLWYGEDIPDGAEIDYADAIAAKEGVMKFKRDKAEAEVDVTQVRRKFYSDVADGDQYWWWIRAERFDNSGGLSLIVDDDQGNLYRYNVSVDGDNVEFSEPTAVTVEYPEKTAASLSAAVAGMAALADRAFVFASRDDTRPEDMPTIQKGGSMDEETRTALAASLGLPEDATAEQIHAEAARLRAESGGSADDDQQTDDQQTDDTQTGADDQQTDDQQTDDQQTDQQAGASATVTLDRATFNRLKEGADAALARAATDKDDAIKNLVSAKVKDGTIPPARREHWTKMAKADFEGAKATLDSMEPGLIPVNERGNAGSSDEGTSSDAVGAGLPDAWFPEIANRRAAAAAGAPTVVNAKEG